MQKVQPAGVVDDGDRGRGSGREGQGLAQIDIAIGAGDGNRLVAGGDSSIGGQRGVIENTDGTGIAHQNAEGGITERSVEEPHLRPAGLDRDAAVSQIGHRTAFAGIGQGDDGGGTVSRTLQIGHRAALPRFRQRDDGRGAVRWASQVGYGSALARLRQGNDRGCTGKSLHIDCPERQLRSLLSLSFHTSDYAAGKKEVHRKEKYAVDPPLDAGDRPVRETRAWEHILPGTVKRYWKGIS